MKTFLFLAALIFSQACHAATAIGAYTGAWWETKADPSQYRTAGQLNLTFFDNGNVVMDVIYDGQVTQTTTASYLTKSERLWKFSFPDQKGIVWTGTVRSGFLTGSFRSTPKGTFAGRFQLAIKQTQ